MLISGLALVGIVTAHYNPGIAENRVIQKTLNLLSYINIGMVAVILGFIAAGGILLMDVGSYAISLEETILTNALWEATPREVFHIGEYALWVTVPALVLLNLMGRK